MNEVTAYSDPELRQAWREAKEESARRDDPPVRLLILIGKFEREIIRRFVAQEPGAER